MEDDVLDVGTVADDEEDEDVFSVDESVFVFYVHRKKIMDEDNDDQLPSILFLLTLRKSCC